MPSKLRKSSRPKYPGAEEGVIFDSLSILAEGGTLDGPVQFQVLWNDMFEASRELPVVGFIPVLGVAVSRNGDPDALSHLNIAIAEEPTYAESEGRAKRMSESWHHEFYQFDRYEKTGRFSKIAVYNYASKRPYVANPGDARWYLTYKEEA